MTADPLPEKLTTVMHVNLRMMVLILALNVGLATMAAPPQEELVPVSPFDEKPSHNRGKPDSASAVFKKYDNWKRITSRPAPATGDSAQRCSPPPGISAGSPEAEGYFQVYASRLAEVAFAQKTPTPFPEGSMLVKELLSASKGGKPRTLLAMVKRDEGFNPSQGDWEYLVLRVRDYPIIVESGRIAHCQACHAKAKETDFVFRSYAGRR